MNDIKTVSSAIQTLNMSGGTLGTMDYTNALKSLSLQQAQLLLTTQGINAEKQQQLLLNAGLIATSDQMSASLVAQSLAESSLNTINES